MTDDHTDYAFLDALRAALLTAKATNRIASRSSPDDLLDLIVRAAARAIPCPESALLLVDREKRVLTFEVVIGSTASSVRDVTVPLGHGIAGLVAASGQGMAVANAQDDPRHARDVAKRSGYLPTTILAVPVIGDDGTPVGVLELLDRQQQPTFSLGDMELLAIFAEQVATALKLRRPHDLLASQLLQLLSSIDEEALAALAEQARRLEQRLDADETAGRVEELAELVATVASRGPAEHRLCMEILTAVAAYHDTTAPPGMEMFR